MREPPGSFADLDLESGYSRLWARGIVGRGVSVAVLDTGVEPVGELRDYIAATRDFTGEGYVGRDGEQSHGTAIAAIVHAVAPEARILGLKVLPSGRRARRQDSVAALQYCVERLPRGSVVVLALSFPATRFLFWGIHQPDQCLLCKAVDSAVVAGLHVVVASGNEGSRGITCPATAERAVTVGASQTPAQADWWKSVSPFRLWWLKQTGWLGKRFGTSFSAAYVAGGIALVVSAVPDLTERDLSECGRKVGRPVRGQRGPDTIAINWEECLVCLMGRERLDKAFPSLPRISGEKNQVRVTVLSCDENDLRVVEALRLAEQYPSLAGHAKAIEALIQVDRRTVSPGQRLQVANYLRSLREAARAHHVDTTLLDTVGLVELEKQWGHGSARD